MPIPFIGAFESTYQPGHDVDVFETSGHDRVWREDLALLRSCGVTTLRYPVRWHRIEATPGRYDWHETDAVLAHLRNTGMSPIVDLLHHTSYPRWLEGGFADPRFAGAYLRFCEAFARRHPDVAGYTLFNEPFSTLMLAGHEGLWPPYLRGLHNLVGLFANLLPAITEASRMYRDLLPGARHVYVDTCEAHVAAAPAGESTTDLHNDRRFFVLDALLGKAGDLERPFVRTVVEAGGESLLDVNPVHIDVLGLDYYAQSQWEWSGVGAGTTPTSTPGPLASLIVEYAERYALPCMLSETNLRGFASDRATWLKYTLEQCELAAAAGVALEGYCWFPFVDSCDWDSLLWRCDGSIDPVGVYWLDEQRNRHPSVMSASFAAAAGGAPAAALPAYRLRPPVSFLLRGYAPQMASWEWVDPPDDGSSGDAPDFVAFELEVPDAAT